MRLHPLLATALLTSTVVAPAFAQGTPIGFAEQFALAADRHQVLALLPAGSQDYYYYACLERQLAGAFDDVPPLLAAWIERYGRSDAVVAIENRQALLTFERDPAATYRFLQDRTGTRFDAVRQSPGAAPDLPTRLDPQLLAPGALLQRAQQLHPGSLDGVRSEALASLAAAPLDDALLTDFLKRLERPDVPNLPALIARNLQNPRSGGFGTLPIHDQLLLDQLEALAQAMPSLRNEQPFVLAWLRRLAPNGDVDWRQDPAARERYLDRLWAFAQRLLPSFRSLQVHVLYWRLQHDLELGVWDRERFLQYLQLPRRADYVRPEFLNDRPRGEAIADLAMLWPLGFPAVGSDQALVRTYLEHFFATEDSWQPYAAFVREDWLKRVFAETKLLVGAGDAERWGAMLDPTVVAELTQRVECAFVPTQRRRFGAADPVGIDLVTKHVGTLLVRVFVVDAFAYLRDTQRPVDPAIDLDGLVANEEQTFTYDDPPLRRVVRHFDFPSLSRPGTYVVEFVGNGQASRAVIQKGALHSVARTGAAGQVVTVLDEGGALVPGAFVSCSGHEYQADANGEVCIPFAPQRHAEPLILRHGRIATLEPFDHLDEVYALAAGVHVAREALLSPFEARLLVRPALTLHGVPIALSLLQRPELVITSSDVDGVTSSKTVRDLAPTADAELVVPFHVPDRLQSLTVQLRGRVANVSAGKDVELASTATTLRWNAIARTAQTRTALLGRGPDGYWLDVRGKAGEPCADTAVPLQLELRDWTDPLAVTLKTDAAGRIHLGPLDGVARLSSPDVPQAPWLLVDRESAWPAAVGASAGTTVRLPWLGTASSPVRGDVSLLEVVDGVFVRDAFAQLAIAGGYLELRDLPAGDYDLWLRATGQNVAVHVTAGPVRAGWVIGRDRLLQRAAERPLQVASLEVAGGELRAHIGNASPATRVHVYATRYGEEFAPFAALDCFPATTAGQVTVPHAAATFTASREIGDEYRYVLDRRQQTKYPGNMLRRPGMLVNPWQIESPWHLAESAFDSNQWNSAVGLGGGASGAYGARGGKGGRARFAGVDGGANGVFADVGFLPQPAPLLANLRPDAQGVVRVALQDLGEGQIVHVVAVDDTDLATASTVLPERPLTPRPRALANGLDPERHFSEQRRIEFLPAGARTTIADPATSAIEQYDSLAKAFQLLQTVRGDDAIAPFAFLVDWPNLADDQKLSEYSQHACHELHFFLYAKDRAFFDRAVRPVLQSKADKTFLDHWLLGDDLAEYVAPWAFARLNIVEQILLTRRLAGRQAAGARLVREQCALLPVDPQQLDRWFRAGLAARSLDGDDALAARDGTAADPGFVADRNEPPPPPPPADNQARVEQGQAGGLLVAPAEKAGAGKDAAEHEVVAGEPRGAEEERKQDVDRRRATRQLYRPPGETLEYAESNWWHVPIASQDASLVTVNAFWRDYALAPADQPFCSPNLAAATRNATEMLLALAVIDLPFVAQPAKVTPSGTGIELQAVTPRLLVRKEIRPAEPAAAPGQVLIGQNLYRLDARYRDEGGQRVDDFVQGELLTGVAYGCQVVVTNPTSSARTLDLLLQIPRGALPVQGGFTTRGTPVQLGPFATASFDYAFYFPAAGDFAHFPAHVAQDGALVAAAPPRALHVVARSTQVDATSWAHVSQDGTPQAVLAFLDQHNLGRVDLAQIAWRMTDATFYRAVIDALRARLWYDDRLWSYGLLHRDEATVREWLSHRDGFVAASGPALQSPLLTIDPVARRSYQRVEFDPLFHSRAHRFGRERVILNGDLAQQYLSLLRILCHTPRLSSDDWLAVTCYLLLQDRVADGVAAFAKVDGSRVATRLQYDYLRCYLDFYTTDHAVARAIAEPYRTHPVLRWRQSFLDVLDQLDEADGKRATTSSADDRTQRQTELAATEPGLDLSVEARQVTLRYRNLTGCRVRYFPLDVEFSFSATPFVAQDRGAFAYIEPSRSDEVALPADRNELTIPLPAEFHQANVMIEVTGGGVTRRQSWLSNSLVVQVAERYGQLQVTQARTGKLLPRAYVKVYARLADGSVHFHKDGYTDLRGRFDYVSRSEKGSEGAQRFAILVLSETDGAVIREALPPGK